VQEEGRARHPASQKSSGRHATDRSRITDAWLLGPFHVEYGSPEFHALPVGDPRRRAAVLHAADCWRKLCESPHVAEILAEWMEWDRRRAARQLSHDLSGAADWRRRAEAPTYATIARRRAEPGRVAAAFRERHGGEYRGGRLSWTTGRPISRSGAA
jgi:hypothetical protein